jgi:hydroxymethylbilane synthase
MRLGTRGSPLALAQAHYVAGRLERTEVASDGMGAVGGGTRPTPGKVEVVPIAITGDAADKSRWVSALEQALLAGEIDLAVHSAKDVPGELPPGLELLGAPARGAAEDVLCGARSLEELPSGARVGTTSLRRAAQLRAARADLNVVAMAGNVDTRLRKLREGACDALVLARAGLERLGRADEIGVVLDPARFVPAPGQGTLVLEGRADDEAVRAAAQALGDGDTWACLMAERALASALGASCNTPLGAHASAVGCGCLELRTWVGLPDGSEWVSDVVPGGFYDPQALGNRAAERMRLAGAGALLRSAEGTGNVPESEQSAEGERPLPTS